MLNVIRPINQIFVFKNSGILCLALIFNLNNQRMTILYAGPRVAGCKLLQVIYQSVTDYVTDMNP